jgi:hypothetical protein
MCWPSRLPSSQQRSRCSSFYNTRVNISGERKSLIGGILSGNLGIKRTPQVELDVNGKVNINNGIGSLPGKVH